MPSKRTKLKPELTNLSRRLKQIRKEKGYSNYEQFAYAHNIARAQYGRYKNGSDIRFTTLIKIIKAFDMTVEAFFSEGFD